MYYTCFLWGAKCLRFFFLLLVAFSADEVIYVWQPPQNKSVDYEGKLQLSQFDIKDTAFRALNYSRGNNSKLQDKQILFRQGAIDL